MSVSIEFTKARRVELELNKRIKIAYLYHENDSAPFDSFYNRYLALLRRGNMISDTLPQVPAGTRFQDYIKPQFEEADIIILFLSIDLEVDSNSRSSPEMIALIDKCYKKGTYIWKISVKSYGGRSVFQEYGDFLGKGKVLASSPLDESLGQIAIEINDEVTQMLSEKWAQDGDNYSHELRFDEALAAYDNSLSYIFDYPPALLGKWRIFRMREMLEEANQCLEKLLSLETFMSQKGKDASFSASQRLPLIRSYCKGCALLDLGRTSEARTAFEVIYQRITLPLDKIQRKLCARSYCGEGDALIYEGCQTSNFADYCKQALDAYEKARSLDQNDPIYLTKIGDAHMALAEAYILRNDRTQMKDHCYDALRAYEHVSSYFAYPPAFIGQGDAYFLLQNIRRALGFYESALDADQYAARAYRGKGNILLALNEPERALQAFERSLSIDNFDASCHYGRGKALAFLKHYQKAFEAYNNALKRNIRQSREFLINYARVLIELGEIESAYGRQPEADRCFVEAEDIYRKTFDTQRSEKDIKYICGKIFFARKNWDVALSFYNEALSIAYDMTEAHLGMGKTYLELGNNQEASNCFKRADKYCQRPGSLIDISDVNTTWGDAYYRVAERSNLEDTILEKAEEYYKEAIKTRENAMAYVGLGKVHAKLGRDQEAIDALGQALKLMPNLVQCYLIKGKCYYHSGQYLEAYAEYKRASEANLDIAPLQKAQGEVLLAMKRYKEALRILQDIINFMYRNMHGYTFQDFAYAFCNKATALSGLEKDEKAIESFFDAYRYDRSICWEMPYRQSLQDIYYRQQKKLYDNQGDFIAYRYRGDVLLMLGDQEGKAIREYTNAIAYGDSSPETYYSRGLVYESTQDYQNAFNDYNTVLMINPSYQEAQEAILRIEQKVVPPQTNLWLKLMSRLKLFTNGSDAKTFASN